MTYDFDLAIIGCGPAGEKAATRAAYLGKSVVVIEREASGGGKCLRGGLPSKVLREAALSYSGARRRLGDLFRSDPEHRLPMEWFEDATKQLCDAYAERVGDKLERHGVRVVRGEARFETPHELVVDNERAISAEFIVIATGSRPVRPASFPFGEPGVYCTDTLFDLEALPKSMIVVGAGAIGAEYASIFATLDVDVVLLDTQTRVLPFLDHEIGDHLIEEMGRRNVRTHLGNRVVRAKAIPGGVGIETEDGGRLAAETLLFAGGRIANTDALGLERVGVELGKKGRPIVNEHQQTSVEHIYAAGDVIGFPALASTGMEQGRVAASHAFLHEGRALSDRRDVIPLVETKPYELLPLGIYTIPSVSMVGQTEQQVQAAGRSYVVGRAGYDDRARGRLIGDVSGVLKLVCDRDTLEVLGVHIVGESAEELIHVGQACMHFRGTIQYFLRTVFNFPTLGSLYKRAAYDVLTRLGPESERYSREA